MPREEVHPFRDCRRHRLSRRCRCAVDAAFSDAARPLRGAAHRDRPRNGVNLGLQPELHLRSLRALPRRRRLALRLGRHHGGARQLRALFGAAAFAAWASAACGDGGRQYRRNGLQLLRLFALRLPRVIIRPPPSRLSRWRDRSHR
ncbi:hypothetical protein RHECNPAF_2530022 [Rhizobium etli CNPAF512]|nr:hypothetical protein RHECNPAF_2530022 [Rhizobium etli CNPAF512]